MKWEAKFINHRKEQRIGVYFEKNAELISRIKKIEGIRWSASLKVWHLPDNEKNRIRFKLGPKITLSPDALVQFEQFKQWLLTKRYSANTIKTYTEALKSFLIFFNNKPIIEISNADVITYNYDYIIKKGLSASFQNQIVNALKLFFATIQNKNIETFKIERPIKEYRLPNVLSKEEVKMILNALSNLKHKTMLTVIYSCGLRRSELLNLKPTDIESNRGVIRIRQSKGKKDRIVPLSPKVLEMLREYYLVYKPSIWLFEGIDMGQYDERSLSNVIKQALAKTTIKKPVTLHWLRHSYATHLLENGTDLRHIQEILGHNSSKTTEIYTHVSSRSIQNIKSPFDDL